MDTKLQHKAYIFPYTIYEPYFTSVKLITLFKRYKIEVIRKYGEYLT